MILQCLWLKTCCGWKGLSVFEMYQGINLYIVYSSVSSMDYITSCNTVFVPQNMTGKLCKGWCVNISCWPSSSDLSTSTTDLIHVNSKWTYLKVLWLVKQPGFATSFKSMCKSDSITWKGSTGAVPNTIPNLAALFFQCFFQRTWLDLDEFAKDGDLPVQI